MFGNTCVKLLFEQDSLHICGQRFQFPFIGILLLPSDDAELNLLVSI